MRNLRLLRRYIREAIDLGNVQFSPKRRDGVDQTEPNTPEEEALYQSLIKRVEGQAPLDAANAKILKDLINSKEYGVGGSGFFGGPASPSAGQTSMLYRGQLYPQQWAEENISDLSAIPRWNGDHYQFGNHFANMKPFPLNPPYVYGPNKKEGFRGWTYDFAVARNFAMKYWMDDMRAVSEGGKYKIYSVILVLDPLRNPPDSLLDFSRNIYKTDIGRNYKHEEEVMNLEPVQCHAAYVLECPYRKSPYEA